MLHHPAPAHVHRPQRHAPERLQVRPVLQHLAEHAEPIQVHELLGRERVAKLLLQRLRVRVAHAERQQRPHVAEHRLSYWQGNLVNVLVRQHQAQPVFPGLGQDGSEAVGGEVLKLVNEQEELLSLLLRLAGPAHRRQLELRHQQGAEEVGLVVADPAFGQVGHEDAPVVHEVREADLAPVLAENVPNDGIQQKLPQLVLNGRDGLAPESLVVSGVFALPKLPNEGVFDLPDHLGAVVVVREQPVDAQEGSAPAVQKGGNGVVEDVFHPRPPRIRPDALERADDAGGHERPFVLRHVGQEIHGEGVFRVGGVEVGDVVGAPAGDVVQDFFG